MALVDFTKQLAKEALGNSAKGMLDSLRPSEMPRIDAPPPSDAASAESVGTAMLAEVRAMQNALKDDAELLVLYNTGLEPLRILEIYSPTPQVAVLIGFDTDRNVTRVVSRLDNVQLTCKVMKVEPPAKPVRITFRAAKKPA